MQDTALYQYLLSLKSPWTVSRVNLDVQGQRVDVWAEHSENATSLNDLRKKVNDEYERTWEALLRYWNTEARQHKNTMQCFGEDVSLPRVTFVKQG